ncbi:UDP-glucose 4-epimerase GalE [Spongiibacter sp. KMU-158]|uniref:UDP-glucose 4-epimerase n=1 Tax=Spongiibacter pelagi TaxID=2760804 RepID=A0A927C2Q7_9GAMM|nr:UDP-glucose 4-epimerase GalE [Spongiibacter pelagi]
MAVLVTGGAGYIGSHCVLVLLEKGIDVVVLDNLANSSSESLARVAKITGKSAAFVQGDVTSTEDLESVFQQFDIESVIHFAGLKAVGESKQKPLEYYENNVAGTLKLLACMGKHQVKKFVFSSSATIYGEEAPVPYLEEYGQGCTTNPYGTSKAMVETILQDLAESDPEWSICALRYFNPVGAHPSGDIGEDPSGIPNNLMPYISQVAIGRREKLSIFGGDYATLDGTCRRDYLHVMDLAEGHLAALNHIEKGFDAINLGTGNPLSVLEMVSAFEQATDKKVAYEIVGRREGDLPEFWANADKAKNKLGWEATRSVTEMMADTWRWQSQNPQGY